MIDGPAGYRPGLKFGHAYCAGVSGTPSFKDIAEAKGDDALNGVDDTALAARLETGVPV